MEIGIGIFLGLSLIALVILFTQTKDRWNWKKITASVSGVVVVASLVIGGLFWWENRPVSVETVAPMWTDELWGLKLGASKSDVNFLKGEPDVKLLSTEDDDDLWVFGTGEQSAYSLSFHDGNLTAIAYEDLSKPPTMYEMLHSDKPYPDLLSVWIGSKGENVEQILGVPEKIIDIEGGFRRRYEYLDRYNVAYTLERNRVISMRVGKIYERR